MFHSFLKIMPFIAKIPIESLIQPATYIAKKLIEQGCSDENGSYIVGLAIGMPAGCMIGAALLLVLQRAFNRIKAPMKETPQSKCYFNEPVTVIVGQPQLPQLALPRIGSVDSVKSADSSSSSSASSSTVIETAKYNALC